MIETHIVSITAELIDGQSGPLTWEVSPGDGHRLAVSFHDDMVHVTDFSTIASRGTNWFVPIANLACLEIIEDGVELPAE